MPDQRILITGATGNIGRELVKAFSAHQVAFRPMVRSHEGDKSLAETEIPEIVTGDFNDSTSVANVLICDLKSCYR